MFESGLFKVDFVNTVFFAGDFTGKMKIFKKKSTFMKFGEMKVPDIFLSIFT
jgi:hypothetical protein